MAGGQAGVGAGGPVRPVVHLCPFTDETPEKIGNAERNKKCASDRASTVSTFTLLPDIDQSPYPW